jgi:beta-mannanase
MHWGVTDESDMVDLWKKIHEYNEYAKSLIQVYTR